MNLLVTGGAGFIGSHFVLRHVERHPEDRIVVLDLLTYAGNKEFLRPVLDRVDFTQGDIADTALVTELVERHAITAIVNFAAETHVDRSIADEHPFIHTNIVGVQSLIDVCKAHPDVRLLHVSTDEVYGDQADEDPPRTVEDALHPSSPYAASKAAGDLLIMAAMRTYGLKAAVTRCTNNYGPHQADEKFMPTVFRSALRDKPVPIYGRGENKRDWLFVIDHTDAIERVLATDEAFNGRFFNISAGNERRNIDLAKKILDLLGKPHSLLTFVPDRPGHDWRYAVDSAAIRALGWEPQVSFEEGLKRTAEWYRDRH